MMQGQTRTKIEENAPDLYCNETLAFFDDYLDKNASVTLTTTRSMEHAVTSTSFRLGMDKTITNNSNLTNTSQEIYKDLPQCVRKLDYDKDFDSCISVLDDNDYMKMLDSHNILNDDESFKNEKKSHHYMQNNFTSHLVKEFTKSSKPDFNREQLTQDSGSTIAFNSNNKAHSASQRWSQTRSRYDQYEQQVPEIILPDEDMDDDDSNIVIIKDEAIMESDSGSELDWNSLTPPVPASPSDQKVPEMESEVNLDSEVYRRAISNSSPELYSAFAHADDFDNSQYFHETSFQSTDFLQSEADQIVPVLLL